MQVTIRMQDVDMLTEVIDFVQTQWGFSPEMETTEDEWCVAAYKADDGVIQINRIVNALLRTADEHGLLTENEDKVAFEVTVN